jgi:hypothetical protein
MLFRKKYKIDEKIRGRLLNRLRNTSDTELLRWIENVHVGIAKDIDAMRKSLTHGNPDQALVYIEDTRTGAVSLLAAMQVLEEKFNLQNQ